MSKPFGIIYKVTNLANGKIYVGQTAVGLKNRIIKHYEFAKDLTRDKGPFQKALLSTDKENFKWEILCECSSREEMNKKEKEYISRFDCFDCNGKGYNRDVGGNGYDYNEATREKLRDIVSGSKNPRFVEMSKPKLEELVKDYKEGVLTNKQLEQKYKVARPTLWRKLDSVDPDIRKKFRKEREDKLESLGMSIRYGLIKLREM